MVSCGPLLQFATPCPQPSQAGTGEATANHLPPNKTRGVFGAMFLSHQSPPPHTSHLSTPIPQVTVFSPRCLGTIFSTCSGIRSQLYWQSRWLLYRLKPMALKSIWVSRLGLPTRLVDPVLDTRNWRRRRSEPRTRTPPEALKSGKIHVFHSWHNCLTGYHEITELLGSLVRSPSMPRF
jgi:hypothetical protein